MEPRNNELTPPIDRTSQWYLTQFQQRWQRVKPYPTPIKNPVDFNYMNGAIKLRPIRSTPALLMNISRLHGNGMVILIGNNPITTTEIGLHESIREEYKFLEKPPADYGYIFENDDGQLVMFASTENVHDEETRKQITEMLKLYKISLVLFRTTEENIYTSSSMDTLGTKVFGPIVYGKFLDEERQLHRL